MIGACYLCGRTMTVERHHIFGGRANRPLSEKYGLVVNLCPYCHRESKTAVHKSKETAQAIHEYGQRKWMTETGGDTEEFIKIFGRNYL